MKIDVIAGARPNFMKIAPLLAAMDKVNAQELKIKYRLIHTGQHYDHNMSEQFFNQLEIPRPHVNLGVGGGTQAQQAAGIMVAYEDILIKDPCDFCLVVGDVTSTMACTLAAVKLQIKVGHVEAGIRSRDRSMPEEINRLVTDALADYFFTTTPEAGENLLLEGVEQSRILFVGNTMIDTLLKNKERFFAPACFQNHESEIKNFVVLTLHRPANVDEPQQLKFILEQIIVGAQERKVFFPVHPRTQRILDLIEFNHPNLIVTSPLSYLEFNYLVSNSALVVTDSGGITEETTVMHIPCITLRNNTERPETCTIGTNELIGTDPYKIPPAMAQVWAGKWKKGAIPRLWDGKTSERIIEFLTKLNEMS